jgi:hypothetical protein
MYEVQQNMILIGDAGDLPDANYDQNNYHNERERVQDHTISVVVLSTVAFEFREAQ